MILGKKMETIESVVNFFCFLVSSNVMIINHCTSTYLLSQCIYLFYMQKIKNKICLVVHGQAKIEHLKLAFCRSGLLMLGNNTTLCKENYQNFINKIIDNNIKLVAIMQELRLTIFNKHLKRITKGNCCMYVFDNWLLKKI